MKLYTNAEPVDSKILLATEYLALKNLLRRTIKTNKEFTLSSGFSSNIFINCKEITLTPLGQKICGLLFNSLLTEDEIAIMDGVAGVPIGGYPIANAFSMNWNSDFPILYVRKEKKNHGTQSLVEGNISPGMNVVLLEDVITTGNSVIESIKNLEEVGCVVKCVFSIVDRETGGIEKIKEQYKIQHVESLFKISDLI